MDLRLITSVALCLLTACSVGSIDRTPSDEPTSASTADVRVMHLAAGVPAIDLFVGTDDTPAVRDLAYRDPAATIEAPTGRVSIDVVTSGQRLRSIDLNLEKDATYTAVVLPDRNLVLEGDETNVAEDATFLRIVHAASSVGRIDVWDLDENALIVEGLSFAEASDATRVELRSRRFGIDVDADQTPDLVYDLGDLPSRTVVDVFAVEEEGTVVLRSYFGEESQASMPMPEEEAPAQIRVLHLSPDAPNVDVYANGDRAVQNIEFTRGTGFLEVPADEYRFEVTATGDTNAVLTLDLELEAGQAFTAVAFDRLENIQALALPESTEPVESGARIRVVHAAVDVGQVDVLDADTNDILLDDVDFGAATAQFAAPAGVHSFGLDLDDDANPELIFDLPELAEGTSANIFAVTDAAGAFLLVQLNDGTTIRVNPRHVTPPPPPPATAQARAIHLSPDAPAVNVFADENETAAISGLTFGNGTGYLELDAGEISLSVSLGTLAEAFLGPLALLLEEDASYTVAVFDRAVNAQALVLEDDLSEPAAGNIRIRAIHTAVDVGPVNIIAGGAPLYEDVPFGAAGDALEVPAGAYVIGLDVDDDHHPDLNFALPELAAGTIANVFAVADAHGTVRLLAQLADGTVVTIDATH